MSYLSGTALQWFEPYLLEDVSATPPLFLSDYEMFQEELRVNFGPYDAAGQSEYKLENLRMSDSESITNYVTQFNRLASQVRWGTVALRYQFYKGLPTRLKDHISEIGKPDSLSELRSLAQALDHRYWERKTESHRELGDDTTSSPTLFSDHSLHSPDSDPSSDSDSGSLSDSDPDFSDYDSDSPLISSSPTTRSRRPSTSYSDKLDKDGRLTQEERQRRFDNHLCLFCGNPGHIAVSCPKKSAPTPLA